MTYHFDQSDPTHRTVLPRLAALPPAHPAPPPAPWPRRAFVLGAAAWVAGCGGGTDSSPAPTAPALDIRADVVGVARGEFTVTFFFADAVHIPADVLPFALSGASVVAGSFRRVDARTCSVRLTPFSDRQGLIDLRVPAGAYQDASGAVFNSVAYEFAQPYDTRRPFATLAVAGALNSLGFITGPVVFTLSFPIALDAPLTAASVLVSAGAVSGFASTVVAGQAQSYRFDYTPPAATNGRLVVELPAGVVASAGLPNELGVWSYWIASA